jgi:DNA adenine methylase
VSHAPRLFLCRYPGGKTRLARWVIDLLPRHERYVEAFAGAAGVLLNKPRSRSEYLVERDAGQATLLRVVRDRVDEFAGRMARVRFSRDTFEDVKDQLRRGEWSDEMDLAGLMYVWRQLSWGGAGRIYSARSRRDLPAWWSRRIASLAPINSRLLGVQIIEGDALEWLQLLDGPGTLAYCDPPYVWASRTDFRPYSRHEMDDEEHRRLLEVVEAMTGQVVLSGYPSPLYDRALEGWRRATTVARCHAYTRGHRPTRTEVLWMSHGR